MYYPLNFGSFCVALESTQPKSLWRPFSSGESEDEKAIKQPGIVAAVMLLPYNDNDLEKLDDKTTVISESYASRCVNHQSKVKKGIRKYTRTVKPGNLQRNIESRIINYLTPQQQAQLLEAVKDLVRQLPLDADPTGLHSYLDLFCSDIENNFSRFIAFLAKCVQFCLLMPNTPREPAKWGWFNKAIPAGEEDPYRLVSDDPGSSAVCILLYDTTGSQEPNKFHCFDKLIQQIQNQCLIIEDIDIECRSGAIQVICDHFHKNGYQLRRLEATDADIVREFINHHEDDFRAKRGWDGVPLSVMAYEGIQTEIWTAYAYFSPDGKLISYLDAKVRIDGSIELGIALTEKGFRGMQLATSLIYFFKLLYPHSRIFGGTYEENKSMRRTFDSTGFSGIMYYDQQTDKMTEKIAERINSAYPTDKTKDTNSVYYFSESLMTVAFRGKTEMQKQN